MFLAVWSSIRSCQLIKDAHTKHKSLTVCWLDLANAFGSVHHQLIDFCLHHYHAPMPFISTIRSLYSNLSATVSAGSWSTRCIPLQVGVYQGDPLSVAIFNTVMVTLTDALKANSPFYRDRIRLFSRWSSPGPYGPLTVQRTSSRKAPQPPSEGGQFYGHQEAETAPLSW